MLQSDMDLGVMKCELFSARISVIEVSVSEVHLPDSQPLTYEDVNHGLENAQSHLGKFGTPTRKIYLSHKWKGYISSVGQIYNGGVTEFRIKLLKYASEKGFKFVYIKNDSQCVTAECLNKSFEGCGWRVHAILNRPKNYFYIKTLHNEHTCRWRIREQSNITLRSKIVSSVLIAELRNNPLVRPIDIVIEFKKNYGLRILYYIAWYGKESAKTEVHGDESKSYEQLVWYVRAVLQTNPGSHVRLECDETSSRFRRIFIAYNSSIEGFKFCRPFLCLDGTFIKNKYKGHLLAATAKNGNEGFFPLAFAIVDSENEANWTWFLENLAEILLPQGRLLTFISDRNKGLLESLSSIFPDSPHAFCLYHLKQNILKKYQPAASTFRDTIVHMFQACAYAPSISVFEEKMNSLENTGGVIIQKFLKQTPKEHSSNAFFKGKKYGEMCSNISKSFNSWISSERAMPIYQMIESIRVRQMELNSDRRCEAENWTSPICLKMENKLIREIEVGRHWDVYRSTDYIFEVRDKYSVMVDLKNHHCSCYQWQINGFPCSYGLAAILKDGGNPFDYVESYFTTEYYKRTYQTPIFPVPDIERDEQSTNDYYKVQPPLTKTPPGRPKVKHFKSSVENTRPMKCGRCGDSKRHNRRSCTTQI